MNNIIRDTLAVLESLPITAIALAAMFGAIGLIILKEKFAKKRDNRTASSAEKNEPEFTAEKLLNGLTDAFNPRDLATKLSNRDIEKLVDGTFESSKALFKFHQPRRINISHSWDKKNNKYEKDVDIISSAKELHIGFETKHNNQLFDAKVSVLINNEWKDVPRVNEIVVSKADSHPLKFSVENKGGIEEREIEIIVLIRSFVV